MTIPLRTSPRAAGILAAPPGHQAFLMLRTVFTLAPIAFGLGGIIVNLLLIPGHYDVALRDFSLLVGALALWRLVTAEHAARTTTP
jgi:hypothetical protein